MKQFLLFHYYGGMVFTAMKRFDRAQHYYRICISTPAVTVSQIMVEACKKYIIVSLLIEGKVRCGPRCKLSTVVQLTLDSYHVNYSSDFTSRDP